VGGPVPRIVSPTATLLVLTLINFFNYVDRYVLAPLIPFLEQPVAEGGLGLSGTQVGLLQTAFMVVHSVASIPLGILGDRWVRPKVIAMGVGLWSLATAAAGFARSYGELFVARAAVGIGEAAYAPAASALISERFSAASRARALGIFQLGMLVGTAVGMVAGGVVGSAFGWRWAFFLVGFPGLILTVLALWLRDDRRPRVPRGTVYPAAGDAPGATPGPAAGGASLGLRAATPGVRPALVLINLAGILITFFVGAVGFWVISFIVHYHYDGDTARVGEATLLFGVIGTAAGVGGALAGSFVADRIERRRPGAGRLIAIAIGALVGAPCAAFGLLAEDLAVLIVALTIGVFFISWYVGPVMAALHDVVPADRRATATGAYLFLVHALGDGISPGIVGVLKDLASLQVGLLVTLIPLALGALAALAAVPFSVRVAAAKGRIAPHP
jgi:MFS transporter, Spinster family, sphingosine-1-phosphate transporter